MTKFLYCYVFFISVNYSFIWIPNTLFWAKGTLTKLNIIVFYHPLDAPGVRVTLVCPISTSKFGSRVYIQLGLHKFLLTFLWCSLNFPITTPLSCRFHQHVIICYIVFLGHKVLKEIKNMIKHFLPTKMRGPSDVVRELRSEALCFLI